MITIYNWVPYFTLSTVHKLSKFTQIYISYDC